MAYFPLFTDSKYLKCLLVGGGAVALRKARILAQFGVKCHVVAKEIDPELEQIAVDNSWSFIKRAYRDSDLTGCNIVVLATSDSSLNSRVSQVCHERSISVNVVDNAELSSFIFPGLVDRGPVTVAISSSGHSPTIARRLRGQIESLLPHSLGSFVEYLGQKRRQFTRSGDAKPDRGFWDQVIDSSVSNHIGKGEIEKADKVFNQLLNEGKQKGFVSLVGAGPGDPDLLTLKALKAMQIADVVYYDNLVSDEILNLVRRDANRIYVGKRRAFRSVRQDEISRMLCVDAEAGLRVLRLKGGDPMLFGRGGEESAELTKNGIDFEVIPGITAALGCAAYAGIPLTHRDYAQSVRFVTGHLKDGSLNLDWPELAKPDQTLVVYMGLSGIEQLTQNLVHNGLAPSTPAAVISRGTLVDQKVLCGTIVDIASKVREQQLPAPTTTIIGGVVNAAIHLKDS